MHVAQAQLIELGQLCRADHALCLIGGQDAGFSQAAQVLGNVVVLCRDSGAGVHHEDHRVGFCNCLAGLLRHFAVNAAGGLGLKAACIDHDEFTRTLAPMTIVAITRQASKIGDDGVARLGQSIKKCRLADVGSADERNDWIQHNEAASIGTKTEDTTAARHNHQRIGSGNRRDINRRTVGSDAVEWTGIFPRQEMH